MTRCLPVIDDSFLDDVMIATPCNADWDAMEGDDRVRRCGECRLDVYDVSHMTRKEAAALILAGEDAGRRPCLRLYRRADGRLLTQDCWTRLAEARRRGWGAFAAALVIVGATQLGVRFAGLSWLMQWRARPAAEIAQPIAATATATTPPTAPATTPATPPLEGPIKGQLKLERPHPVMGGMPPPASRPPKTESKPIPIKMGKPMAR